MGPGRRMALPVRGPYDGRLPPNPGDHRGMVELRPLHSNAREVWIGHQRNRNGHRQLLPHRDSRDTDSHVRGDPRGIWVRAVFLSDARLAVPHGGHAHDHPATNGGHPDLPNHVGPAPRQHGALLGHPAFGLGATWIVLSMRNFISALPKEVEEAAHVAGASDLKVFFKIV